jgi:adenylate cyclase, class 2
MKEIEIKIKLDDREALIKKVEELGGKRVIEDEGLVYDVLYNNAAGDFNSGNYQGKHLRLRRAPYGNRLTYKEKNNDKEHHFLLNRTEIEVGVGDFEKTDLILQKLGFFPHRYKEKQNVEYQLDGFRLEFHKMPFLGNFLEIEAEESELKKILPKLGLKIEQGINQGYHKLFYEYCEQHGWSIETPMTFEEEKKHLPPHRNKPSEV